MRKATFYCKCARTALSLQAEYMGLGSSQIALTDYVGQPVRIVLGTSAL